jgi:GNAT superfamily N-acetyltransferase
VGDGGGPRRASGPRRSACRGDRATTPGWRVTIAEFEGHKIRAWRSYFDTVALRWSGIGTGLLDAAESEAAVRGCHQVALFTHRIQAPGFYERRGYEIVERVDNYPSGSDALWYRKRLRGSER